MVATGTSCEPPADWTALDTPVLAVSLVQERLEDVPADATAGRATLVDFANEQLHVGDIWPTATQEELLFSLYPQLFPAILISETMLDHEVSRGKEKEKKGKRRGRGREKRRQGRCKESRNYEEQVWLFCLRSFSDCFLNSHCFFSPFPFSFLV